MKCDPSSTCPGRCYKFGCCHPECAVGCFGPFETDCIVSIIMMCKYFKHDGRCVSSCPTDITYREAQFCVDIPFFKQP
ncbi:hypothetical protein KUTeg_001893 [Tegillarca granosa]|uniref:Furin-like cysteine-rich domain-containing protein n=1 Tax=Tegillarca granosa TaxID=220873 RepID=A0ABQ9FVX6_TEGGR|nr:hypothetical protein KUTeg_001893 [Tegillarca granosa]